MSKKEITVTLATPVEHGSETIEKLTLRRPKGKDLRKLPMEPELGDILDFAGRLAGVTPSVMDEMDAADVVAVAEAVADFLPSGPATGASGSAR